MAGKISDLIINEEGNVSYSFEVTPDLEEHELENLELEPLFFSVTWHAQGHKCENLDIAPLKLAKFLRNNDKNVLLHVSCSNMKKDYLDELLVFLKDKGICNLFIILGEKYDSSTSDFKSSQDLILYIKQRTGNYFCIGVAGYPDRKGNILQLKEKVDCGADFILTQAFFEYNVFNDFVINCKEAGITIPIIPGIFLFESEIELNFFVNLCKVHVTEDLLTTLSTQPGIEIVAQLIQKMIQKLNVKHLHFFTLNKLQRTINMLKTINCLK